MLPTLLLKLNRCFLIMASELLVLIAVLTQARSTEQLLVRVVVGSSNNVSVMSV